jgi:hypothetical protein
MRSRTSLAIILMFLPTAARACKCAESSPAELRTTFERIALVEVIQLGPEFDGQSPVPTMTSRNRNVRVRVIEVLAGNWAAVETVQETLRLGAAEFDCPLSRRMGDKFILLLTANQSLADGCNTRTPDAALVKALRG